MYTHANTHRRYRREQIKFWRGPPPFPSQGFIVPLFPPGPFPILPQFGLPCAVIRCLLIFSLVYLLTCGWSCSCIKSCYTKGALPLSNAVSRHAGSVTPYHVTSRQKAEINVLSRLLTRGVRKDPIRGLLKTGPAKYATWECLSIASDRGHFLQLLYKTH